MGRKYTEAQKRATAEYMKDKSTIRAVVTLERKAFIETHASARGESVSEFVNRAIDEAIKRDKENAD